jgi:hypothetical protein
MRPEDLAYVYKGGCACLTPRVSARNCSAFPPIIAPRSVLSHFFSPTEKRRNRAKRIFPRAKSRSHCSLIFWWQGTHDGTETYRRRKPFLEYFSPVLIKCIHLAKRALRYDFLLSQVVLILQRDLPDIVPCSEVELNHSREEFLFFCPQKIFFSFWLQNTASGSDDHGERPTPPPSPTWIVEYQPCIRGKELR